MTTYELPNFPVELTPDPEWQKKGVLYYRNALSEENQQILFNYLVAISKTSTEYEELQSIKFEFSPWPILSWNQVYTRESNVERCPTELLDWFQQLFDKSANFCPSKLTLDSVYGQLYPNKGGLPPHFDIGIDWGGSISLGGSSDLEMTINGEKVVLKQYSGDIVLADFGHIEHAVNNCNEDESPDWWKQDTQRGNKARCNIQLRDTSKITKEIAACRMSHGNYIQYLKSVSK